jgi:type I restriction enzyme S subunit
MTQNSQIPKGYKDSPLGIIPESWEVKRIKDFGRIVTGNTPSTTQPDNYGDEYMFVGPADLSFEKYITTTEKMLSRQGFSQSRKMPEGTVLFTCIGSTIGKSGIASTTLTSNQQINAVICNCESSNEFLYYELNFRSGKIKSLAGEQAVPIINKTDFENIKVIFPPLPEQQKIAEILSVWDEAIEKQTQLIAKLETRKRGLMQQLLLGKKRYNGFSEIWQEYRLDNFFKERNETKFDHLPLLSVGQDGIYLQTNSDKKDISNDDKSKYKRICIGDIGYNTMRMWQGRSALSQLEGIISPAYTVVIPQKQANSLFFSYLFKSSKVMNLFWRNSQGLVDDTLNCKYKDFSLVKINLPNREEQTVIANLLSEADNEIDLAKQKLAKLKEQKKGLMQVLLTGKKRVAVL